MLILLDVIWVVIRENGWLFCLLIVEDVGFFVIDVSLLSLMVFLFLSENVLLLRDFIIFSGFVCIWILGWLEDVWFVYILIGRFIWFIMNVVFFVCDIYLLIIVIMLESWIFFWVIVCWLNVILYFGWLFVKLIFLFIFNLFIVDNFFCVFLVVFFKVVWLELVNMIFICELLLEIFWFVIV